MSGNKQKAKRYGFVMAVYLLGIFIGAIDTGILTPARTIVQNSFGVDERTGIWMITAFTLSYACSMPILGKLADRTGRKRVRWPFSEQGRSYAGRQILWAASLC